MYLPKGFELDPELLVSSVKLHSGLAIINMKLSEDGVLRIWLALGSTAMLLNSKDD